jgi:hypothetical protein
MSLVQRMALRWKKPGPNDLVKLKAGEDDDYGFLGSAACVVRDDGAQFEVEVLGNPPMHRSHVPHAKVEIFLPQDCAFPLAQLPMPCLSRMLGMMGSLADAVRVARVSKRFLAAFRDQIAWRLRVQQEGLMRADDEQKNVDWFRAYYDRTNWRVTIVPCEFPGGMGGLWQSNRPFLKLLVRPSMLLSTFIAQVQRGTRCVSAQSSGRTP